MKTIIKIDGKKIKNASDAYTIFKELFKLPDYFSNNLNSLEECLNDLSWFGDNIDFELIICNSDFFIKDNIQIRDEFLDILQNINLNYASENQNQKFTLVLR